MERTEICAEILDSQHINPYSLCLCLPVCKMGILSCTSKGHGEMWIRSCLWRVSSTNLGLYRCSTSVSSLWPQPWSYLPYSSRCPVQTMILVTICCFVDWHYYGYGWCLSYQGHWEPGYFNDPRGDLFLFLRTMNLEFDQGSDTWARVMLFHLSKKNQGCQARKRRSHSVPGPTTPH